MAFADTIRATTATMHDVGDLLEDLLLVSSDKAASSTINTTSTTLTDYTGASISITTVTGQILITSSNIQFSHSADAIRSTFAHTLDGTDAGILGYYTSSAANTSGGLDSVSMTTLWAPSAGAHTFKIRWETDSGTVYSAGYQIYALALRIS